MLLYHLLYPIGSLGPTEYPVQPFRVTARVTAGVTVERLPSVRDYVQSKKPHRPGISSLILTLELCSVALLFALPYMYISSAIGWVTAGHREGHRGHRLPGRWRRAAMTPTLHIQDRFYQNHSHIVALIL